MVMLSMCGVKFRTTAEWRKALTDPVTGCEFDLDTDLEGTLSSARVTRDQSGKLKEVISPTSHRSRRGKSSLGHQVTRREFVNPTLNSVELLIDDNMGRLALKMAIAAAKKVGHSNLMEPSCRRYLAEANPDSAVMRVDFQSHAPIDSLRSSLAHSVFVKGNANTGRCYAVVEFFGAIQLYVILDEHSFRGADFGVWATLDPITLRESIGEIEPFGLHEPPAYISSAQLAEGKRAWADAINTQINEVFGEAKLTIGFD